MDPRARRANPIQFSIKLYRYGGRRLVGLPTTETKGHASRYLLQQLLSCKIVQTFANGIAPSAETHNELGVGTGTYVQREEQSTRVTVNVFGRHRIHRDSKPLRAGVKICMKSGTIDLAHTNVIIR